ncbi:MAG: hypothetical protein V3T60_12695 [Candidatus Binatia bacterium]
MACHEWLGRAVRITKTEATRVKMVLLIGFGSATYYGYATASVRPAPAKKCRRVMLFFMGSSPLVWIEA